MLYAVDIGVFALVFGLSMFIGESMFPTSQMLQKIFFYICAFILGIYLIMRPRTNPGRENWRILLMLLTNWPDHGYQSFGYYEFDHILPDNAARNGVGVTAEEERDTYAD
ncbi:hypothetical protein FD35_GL000729 [Furfurilactobacillus rossiae DSM 15814]|uniref:Uncharacterized protein n=1 Tax=Furfurilactobacillus rossiae DSM 15814 TaxID=1114972 RepID=A0A0R1RGY5_9LACO|nr:hypothetical protein FD35_GL000729 [Furfurilactobacillus rossiae DSM 15814]